MMLVHFLTRILTGDLIMRFAVQICRLLFLRLRLEPPVRVRQCGQVDRASVTKRIKGPNPRSAGYFGGRRQLVIARLTNIPELMRPRTVLCCSKFQGRCFIRSACGRPLRLTVRYLLFTQA